MQPFWFRWLPANRQHHSPVRITAGSMVVFGIVLALQVSPWFMALSAFVGAGLVFAGVSNTCAMASILGMMPWNRRIQTPVTHRVAPAE